MASTYLYLRVPDLTEHLSEYRAPKLQNEYINIDPAQFYFILQVQTKKLGGYWQLGIRSYYYLLIITNKINLCYLCTNYLTFCSYKRCQFSQRITTQHIRLLEGQGCRDHRNIKMSQVQIYFYFPKISIKKILPKLGMHQKTRYFSQYLIKRILLVFLIGV